MVGPVFFSTSYTSCKCCYVMEHISFLVMMAPKHPTRGFFFPTHTVTKSVTILILAGSTASSAPKVLKWIMEIQMEKTGSVDWIIPGHWMVWCWKHVDNIPLASGQPLKLWMLDSKNWMQFGLHLGPAQANQECEAHRANRAPFFRNAVEADKGASWQHSNLLPYHHSFPYLYQHHPSLATLHKISSANQTTTRGQTKLLIMLLMFAWFDCRFCFW